MIARWLVFLSLIDRDRAVRPARQRSRGRLRATSRARLAAAFWVVVGASRSWRSRSTSLYATVGVRAPLDLGVGDARAADARLRVRPRLPRPRAGARALRPRGRDRALARPARSGRSGRSPSSLALAGALLAAAAALLVPGRRRPRRADVAARARAPARLAPPRARRRSGSAGSSACSCSGEACPRSSDRRPRRLRAALLECRVRLGRGAARDRRLPRSVLHLPTLGSLWQTSYGKAIIVKALLLARRDARRLPSTSCARRRRCAAPTRRAAARRCSARLVSGEVAARHRGRRRRGGALEPRAAAEGARGHRQASAHAGPGAGRETSVEQNGYRVELARRRRTAPRCRTTSRCGITRNGAPVRGADVTARFTMLDMEMPSQEYVLARDCARRRTRARAPALVMVGHWGVALQVTPPHGAPFTVLLVDKAGG